MIALGHLLNITHVRWKMMILGESLHVKKYTKRNPLEPLQNSFSLRNNICNNKLKEELGTKRIIGSKYSSVFKVPLYLYLYTNYSSNNI